MITAAELKPLAGGDWTRARIIQQLMEWAPTTDRVDPQGRAVMVPILKNMARRLKVQTPAISKAMYWLERQGIISITKILIGRVWRLQIRLLVRLRKPSGNRAGNRQETVYTPNTPDKTNIPLAKTSFAETIVFSLRGSLSGAHERVKKKTEEARGHARGKAPRPKTAAHEWVRILGEYGYQLFDPNDGKHLKHIAKTLTNIGAKTLGEFSIEIERRVGMWQNSRPKHLGKAPPHPWAINRTDVIFQSIETQMPDDLPVLQKDKIYQAPKVDKPIAGSQSAKPMLKPQTPKQKLAAFLANKKDKDE